MSEHNEASDSAARRPEGPATRTTDESQPGDREPADHESDEPGDREPDEPARLRDKAAAATERARAVKETVTSTIASTKEAAAEAFDKVIDSIDSLGRDR